MGFLDSLIGRGSNHGKAMSLYKRGMVKAKKHDHKGAIDDYSATINMSDAPYDVIAMALYNRALVHAAVKDNAKAIDDLNSVLAMTEIPANVKTAADEKLQRMNRRAGN